MTIIGQMEKTFLVCHYVSSAGDKDYIVLVDPHAADERIRLEKLIKKLVAESDIQHQIARVKLSKECSKLVKDCRKYLALVGMTLANCSWTAECATVDVKGSKLCHELMGHLGVTQLVQIVEKCLYWFAERREISASAPLSPSNIPKALLDLLSSKACRTAVMFGTLVTRETCELIIDALVKCDFPFQCGNVH